MNPPPPAPGPARTTGPARLSCSVALALACCLALMCAPSGAGASTSCPNEAIRSEQAPAGPRLPECRAYELVTQPGAHPNLNLSSAATTGLGNGVVEAQAAADGGAIAYRSWYSPQEAPSVGHVFVSRRGADGWSTTGAAPPFGPETFDACLEKWFFSSDLGLDAFQTNEPGWSGCQEDEPVLVAGEPLGTANVFLNEMGTVNYQLVDAAPAGVTPANARFQGASADMTHILFTEAAPLVAGAPAGSSDLWVWDEGSLHLVTYLPAGTPVAGSLADAIREGGEGFGASPAMRAHAISTNGEEVVFNAESGGRPGLYLRERAAREASAVEGGAVDGEQCEEAAGACTIQLDAAQPGAEGAAGGGQFWWADAEGSRVYFTDESRLTVGATARTGRPDLYEYDVGAARLTDLTADASEAADVLGIAGASEDGSYVYFVADGVLTGEQRNGEHKIAVAGSPNLYLRHAGTTTFIATLSAGDGRDWGTNTVNPESPVRAPESATSAVSPDGTLLAFNTVERLTGYNNLPAQEDDCWGNSVQDKPGSPCNEIFLYDATTNGLTCVSCGTPGVRPAGMAELRPTSGTYARQDLLADGRVFFDTPSSLLPQDSDGVSNVYEWSPDGVGECSEESTGYSTVSGGCVYSISAGDGTEGSYFADASETGQDVYFLTAQRLTDTDTDNGLSLYDARVDGGFAEPTSAASACQGEECRAAGGAAPTGGGAPASIGFSGPGNAVSTKPITKTRKQKLAGALKRCRRKPKAHQAACEEAARRRYGQRRQTHRRASTAGHTEKTRGAR